MRRIYLPEACHALGIDSATLYRWLKRAGIPVQSDEIDKRKRYITQSDVRTLARQHGKQPSNIYHADIMQTSDTSEYIDEQMNKLTALFDSKLTALQKQIDEIKEDIARLLAHGAEVVPLAEFARVHGIAKTSYKRYAQAVGARKDTRNIWYLDEASKAAFYAKFHDSERFTPCPSCPHNTA